MVKTRSQTKVAENADLLALLAEMKKFVDAGHEEIRSMRAGQEEMKQEMRSGQERMEQVQEEMKNLIPTVKSLTFDGRTSWTVFKTQFDVVSSTNGWTDRLKASQLVASLRGSAAEFLQGIPADKLTDLTTIEKALESSFGDSHLTKFYQIEQKTRRQKPGESLQVLAADVELLMSPGIRRVPSGCSGQPSSPVLPQRLWQLSYSNP
ncbi:hypothetical protein AVEN_112380-1 [Araneus ventricosus]|uniref:Retrotransposon gag domain-containing protein n=1 Tax=Araneus ventricosus TaxID=182803 RepID=A0A4Y2M576_ARAVE|nr:hypothetical protein AVEN_112380-1 [Araneus ventricosus]